MLTLHVPGTLRDKTDHACSPEKRVPSFWSIVMSGEEIKAAGMESCFGL